jgi:hypothetical protein
VLQQTANRALDGGRVIAFETIEETACDQGFEIAVTNLDLKDAKAATAPCPETRHPDRTRARAATNLCCEPGLSVVVRVLLF